MKAQIAVVMPVLNGMQFIGETLASVRLQNYPELELLVIDDGSTDGTQEFIRNFKSLPIRLLECRATGPAAARNAGVQACSADLIAFLDADDLWPAGTLQLLTEALAANPSAGFSQGLIRNFRESPPGIRQFLTAPYRFLNLGACLWRRETLTNVGLLDEDFRLCEDLDLMMRLWEHNVAKAEIDAVTLHYRRHRESMTHGLSGAGFGSVKAYKKRIDRIRAGVLDPKAPRATSLNAYLGNGPMNQDGGPHAIR